MDRGPCASTIHETVRRDATPKVGREREREMRGKCERLLDEREGNEEAREGGREGAAGGEIEETRKKKKCRREREVRAAAFSEWQRLVASDRE